MLNEWETQVFGTDLEATAGEFLVWHLYQDPIVACMAKHGFDYTPPKFVYDAANRGPVGPDMAYLAPLANNWGIAEGVKATAGSPDPDSMPNPGYENLGEKQKQAYDDTLDSECADPKSGYEDAGRPVALTELEGEEVMLLVSIGDRFPRAIEDYQNCMKRADYPTQSPNDLREQIAGLFNEDGTNYPGPGWQDVATTEHEAASADSRCRATLYELGMMELGKELPQFITDHVDDVSKIQAEWQSIVDRAAAYPDWQSVSS